MIRYILSAAMFFTVAAHAAPVDPDCLRASNTTTMMNWQGRGMTTYGAEPAKGQPAPTQQAKHATTPAKCGRTPPPSEVSAPTNWKGRGMSTSD